MPGGTYFRECGSAGCHARPDEKWFLEEKVDGLPEGGKKVFKGAGEHMGSDSRKEWLSGLLTKETEFGKALPKARSLEKVPAPHPVDNPNPVRLLGRSAVDIQLSISLNFCCTRRTVLKECN